MASIQSLLVLLVSLVATASSTHSAGEENFEVKMPGARVTKDDEYRCFARKLPAGQNYIVGFDPGASAHTVHHMLVFVCSEPSSISGSSYECLSPGEICRRDSRIIYAWGRDADGMALPKGVGIAVGGDSDSYIAMQLHYTDASALPPGGDHSGITLRITSQRPAYLSAILLFNGLANLQPRTAEINVDIACGCKKSGLVIGECVLPSVSIHPFAFRTHAHDRATQISAYIIRDRKWILIGTQSPQRPQAFYPVPDPSIVIRPDDIVTARCTYNTTGQDHYIRAGSTREDEMCNFYMMYYVTAHHARSAHFRQCVSQAPRAISSRFPHPPLPFFNGTEGHHHHHHHPAEPDDPPTRAPVSASARVPQLTVLAWPSSQPGHFSNLQLGQVGGVATHPHSGLLYVFHRASRVWSFRSFDYRNVFNVKLGPIVEDTVAVVDPNTGTVLSSWGAGLFYMPHGIFIDGSGNIWVTDVARHQVMMFSPNNLRRPSLTLGERFIPDDDTEHFCKPADVVVDAHGYVYVADGYCNQRIMKFNSQGRFLREWDHRGLVRQPPRMKLAFHIPHALTLNAKGDRLCVADRENGRILCYNPHTGQLMTVNTPAELGGRVFSIAFSKNPEGYLYAVKANTTNSRAQGFTLLPGTKTVLNRWSPGVGKSFSKPHTMTVANDGSVFVGEIGPDLLWKFSNTNVASPSGGLGTSSSSAQGSQSPDSSTMSSSDAAPTTGVLTSAQQQLQHESGSSLQDTASSHTELSEQFLTSSSPVQATTEPPATTMPPTSTVWTTAAQTTTVQAETTVLPTSTAGQTTSPQARTTTATTDVPTNTLAVQTSAQRLPTDMLPTAQVETDGADPAADTTPAVSASPTPTPSAVPFDTMVETSPLEARMPSETAAAFPKQSLADVAAGGLSETSSADPLASVASVPHDSNNMNIALLSASPASVHRVTNEVTQPVDSHTTVVTRSATHAPAIQHEHDDDRTTTNTVQALPATTAYSLLHDADTINIGVVFLLSFVSCILLLILLVASVQYCNRRQRQSRGPKETPLRKLVRMAKRNGKANGGAGEFQKLQQEETSESEEF
ncbi:peptidyl-glycine alpha-amidating monooxygenase-like [Sycon ciliatum]|uniref:peptidyl-glycine alpha-amidating monooxygenase-like n=1 Tax=Sycon ciliatum TaxID=27933 RepID=UPI0031F63FE3